MFSLLCRWGKMHIKCIPKCIETFRNRLVGSFTKTKRSMIGSIGRVSQLWPLASFCMLLVVIIIRLENIHNGGS